MARQLFRMATVALVGFGVVALAAMTVGAKDDAPPTIKKIMGALNKGPASESSKLKKSLAAKNQNWKAIQSSAKAFATLGAALGKNEPPKGEKASWETLTVAYATESKALEDAAEKKDLGGTKEAFKNLSMSCMSCHRAHKK